MSDSNAVPWMQIGPKPAEPWAWDRPELRPQLRIGMVLETYDCGYIRVEEITPDGVVSRTPDSDRHLWTWADLQRLECTVVEEGEEEHRPAGGVVVSERGGRLEIPVTRDRSWLNSTRSLPENFDVRLLDAEIAMELLDLIPSAWTGVHLSARAAEGGGEDFQLTFSQAGSTVTVQPSGRLKKALKLLHQLSGRRQVVAWQQLSFTVHRCDAQHLRYEIQFGYS